MTEQYAKEHDLLKLCDNYEGSKVHYCPDHIYRINPTLYSRIEKSNGFRALKHHCVFRSSSKKHCCNHNKFYPITKEEFFLALADVKASIISRKLNVGFRKGPAKHERIIWDTYHVWFNKSINECIGEAPKDQTILDSIVNSGDIGKVFEEREKQILRRSEDAWKCPFASLMTHSALTEKWFDFFMKNNDYFGVPDKIVDIGQAEEIKTRIQGSRSRMNPQKGLSVYFIRLKLYANQNLSRIVDTEIIQNISKIISSISKKFEKSQELYCLYDEIILVTSKPESDLRTYIEENLQGIKKFTTNYYIEGNYAEATLLRKDLLVGYNKLFQDYQYTFYPELKNRIDPNWEELGDRHFEAYQAKLCELCNMAEASKTFWKFNANDDEQKIHECLCENCFSIRERQKKAIQEEQDITHGIGYKIEKWGDTIPGSKLCFIMIDLNLTILNELIKEVLINEFPLKNPTDKYNDENIGFSILYEFLKTYEEFLAFLKSKIHQIEKYNAEQAGVSNEFQILDNFICLRLDDISEMKDVLSIFVETYTKFFPQLKGFKDGKNKSTFPITLSATISNIKFPFFESWRYLNQQKYNLMNILVVRSFELKMDYREYQYLNRLDFSQKRISSFLHKLVDIDNRAKSELLINMEIYNYRIVQGDIFEGITKNYYKISQLINYFKLIRNEKWKVSVS